MRERKVLSLPEAMAFGTVAEAQMAAVEKNLPNVFAHLKLTDQWTMDFARQMGKNLVIAAIKQSRSGS